MATTPPIGYVLPVGGPVPADYVVGRSAEIDELERLLSEVVPTMLSGERRIGKTTICNAVCARLKSKMETVRIEVPEREDADALAFLQLIVDRCNTMSVSAKVRRAIRTTEPAIAAALKEAGIPLNLIELGAEPGELPARQVLSLPLTLADQLRKPVIFFLDELQRAVDYTDGTEILQALVDVYSETSQVVVLVDGSNERTLEHLRGAPVQFDKLCTRISISPHIPKQVWRESLPDRFGRLGMTITPEALATIVDFGEERPYETMAAAQGAAIALRRLSPKDQPAEIGPFEADQGIASARKRLSDDI